MYIDTHFHLNLIDSDLGNQKKVLLDSISHETITGINIFTSVDIFQEHFDIVKFCLDKGFKVACGWYPEHECNEKMIGKLEEVIRDNEIFAIGEIGLDYYRMHKDKNTQIKLFERQLEIAKKYKKPVIIHTREAFEDTLNTLKNFPEVKGIIHCFSGGREEAKKFLDIGYYISFAGNITFKKAVNLQETIMYIPRDRIFLETDSPFLAPIPKRGQKNLPYYVKYTYDFVSKLLNMPLELLISQIRSNWESFCSIT